jgi:hypothetical protein
MLRSSFLFLFFLFAFKLFSQPGAIRGFVYDKENGEPVIFTSVYLKGTTFGAATDVNGFFSITKIPAGKYILTITYIGYDSLHEPVSVKPNEIVNKKLYITQSSIKLDDVTVSAEKQEMRKSIQASVTKVTPKQIDKLPTIGAQPDIAQYLQIVPGVIFTGDQGGQLYIRGGSPIQNKVLLDGMVIYNPFHSIGLFSVFDADIMSNTDVYTGGFNAQYGGRISSVMDITTRDGNKRKLSGKLSGDTFGGKLLLEGPLMKSKDENDMSLTYILSAKTSYLDRSSKKLYSYVTDEGLPFGFTDLYGKLSMNGASGSKVNAFGFHFTDYVKNYHEISNLKWNQDGFGANIVVVPRGFNALISANMAYSGYKIKLEQADNLPRESSINGFNMGLTFTYFLGDDQLEYGVEVLGYTTNFEYAKNETVRVLQNDNTSEMAGFLVYKKHFGNLIVEPGFRYHYYASLSEASPEPRIGIKYKITDKLRLKAAGGLYSQNLIAANSDKDVVNLFYGFLSGSGNLPETFDGKEVKSALQKSRHAVIGFEYDISQRLDLNVEGYYKYNSQTTELNRNKIFSDGSTGENVPEILWKDFAVETGKAYGADFLFKYDYRHLYLWFVYSYGFVKRTGEFLNEDGQVITKDYYAHFDRRHSINLLATYTFGKDLDWEFGARWNFGTGFPFTQTKGYYEQNPISGHLDEDITLTNGELACLLGDINSARLPTYHRLDINLKKTFYPWDGSELQCILSITNVYDRNNMFYVDRVANKKVYQLPILPSIGMSLSF